MGPLTAMNVVEFSGLAPGPFCGMMLSDLGAHVIRIDRIRDDAVPSSEDARFDVLGRGKSSVCLDLKHPDAVAIALSLVDRADALIEGFRPGVMERLGLGPEVCLVRNPGLVYGRLTGWGQDGPYAESAGHDINYIAIAGVLDQIGLPDQAPVPPLNLLADFAGGGLLLALGMMAALFEREKSGKGQVVDASMAEGASLLATWMHGAVAAGKWRDGRGNLSSPLYGVYECADGQYVCISATAPSAFADLWLRLDLAADSMPDPRDQTKWPGLRVTLASKFRSRTRAEWCSDLEGRDTYFSPLLALTEAPFDRHNEARCSFQSVSGVVQPSPAPRFSRSETSILGPPPSVGADTDSVLAGLGIAENELARLHAERAIA